MIYLMLSNQVPSGPDTEGMQNTSSRSQPGNPSQPGFTVLNHPFQIPQFSPAGALPRQRVLIMITIIIILYFFFF